MIKVAVSGCNGRMGRRIKSLVEQDPGLELAGAFDIDADPRPAIKNCDVLIEFTTPEATVKNLAIAKELGKAAVIGTTGLDEKKLKLIKEAASKISVVFSPNMAVGVNLLFNLTEKAASVLDKRYSASISETHHVHKKDAPSGTAKKLRGIIAGARKSHSEEIKVESKRIGEVVGDHTVVFDGKEERIEITHHAKSRDVFTRGAIVAAKFAAKKKPGLYSMDEVLGIGQGR
ncbi:MAG: 4-hydroxy-tetrahydrodipicolinate reductase [Candidatus Omnitrophica bacterium]|nr:4-hydroxy-tetrahydrodipicolinate reductase [Candidatus Omnitrophota bacterium]